MTPITFSEIQSEVESAGFVLLGIHPPIPPPHYPAFISWIDQDLHAEMDWMAKPHSLHLRENPALLLPGCRSLISLAVRHPQSPAKNPMRGRGRVASYALAADYHRVLPPLLKTLGRKISRMAGRDAKIKVFVDSSPILERDQASMSGLCWVGKNTCLISPELGSFLLLAEILLDIDLSFSERQESDRCGTCRRCIDACPTACIRPDRLIDAGRCISYLTIEHKGAIPAELRPSLGDLIFGCDVCQTVCPWNQKPARQTISSIFDPILRTGYLDLADELHISQDEFSQRYNGLPIIRSGFENHIRNAIICAGNSQMEELVPALGDILANSPSFLLRGHAAWALGRLASFQSRIMLNAALKKEDHPEVENEIRRSMENNKNTEG